MACHVSYMNRPLPCIVTHSLPCVTHMVRHVSLDTRSLEIREIPTVSESNKIRLDSWISQDDSNSEIHFVIRDLEKSQLFLKDYSDKLSFCPFSEKFKCKHFTGFTLKDICLNLPKLRLPNGNDNLILQTNA